MNRIKEFRSQLSITQLELAERIGWKQSRISNYESGIRSPTLADSRRIVSALNSMGATASLDDVFPPCADSDAIKPKKNQVA